MKDIDYHQLIKPWHESFNPYTQEEMAPSLSLATNYNQHEEDELCEDYDEKNTQLQQALLGHIHAQSPDFFEHLIIDLMLAMGYGSRRRDMAKKLGRKGDCGVDGVIEQDILGLDLIYLQAKRFKPSCPVPISDIRDFVGSLDAHHASKGVFFSTSAFTRAARNFVSRISRQVILIDGAKLTELMIRYNIGVKIKKSIQFKRIDTDYFSHTSYVARTNDLSAKTPCNIKAPTPPPACQMELPKNQQHPSTGPYIIF